MASEQPPQRTTERMVCFALYAAAKATTQAYRRLLEPWDLTYPQYLVLVTLWNEGPLTIKELGERMQLDSGTLSPLLRRMEGDGLVARERGGVDARSVSVRTTARATELRAELAHVPGAIARGLGLADGVDAAGLLETLHGLTASMHAVVAEPSSVVGQP